MPRFDKNSDPFLLVRDKTHISLVDVGINNEKFRSSETTPLIKSLYQGDMLRDCNFSVCESVLRTEIDVFSLEYDG